MKKKGYISLFSSAGIGCHGFKLAGFECVATNELLDERLDLQKVNEKCSNLDAYVLGDIKSADVKSKIIALSDKWTKQNKSYIDVVLATPPCQGMSTANYKKNDKDLERNSLVVEAVKMVDQINPKIFIFENVRSFNKTICTDDDQVDKPISEMIIRHLGSSYNIISKVINFKDYGVPSSRPRTLVIGTRKDYLNLSPLLLFPDLEEPVTLRDAIGNLQSIKEMGKISDDDIYHFFRPYPKYMRKWICNLDEKQSAFSNDDSNKPYRIVKGEKRILKSGHLGNKFRRLSMDSPGACIATRNDQLASQDTIHPKDDRVLSIRELMRLMTIPDDFKWANQSESIINNLSLSEKRSFLKKNELKIRRSIGEAVPTKVIKAIAENCKELLDFEDYVNNKSEFSGNKSIYTKMYDFEVNLMNHKNTGSFYTPNAVIFHTVKKIDVLPSRDIKVLEPSVGVGAFILQFSKLINNSNNVIIDVVDVDIDTLNFIKENIEKELPNNIKLIYHNIDFLSYKIEKLYDYVIGNPPFFTIRPNVKKNIVISNGGTRKSNNIFSYFLDKIYGNAKEIAMILPKTFLMSPQYNNTKSSYEEYNIKHINDFGVKYFKKVFIEIISIHFIKKYSFNIVVEDHVNNEIFNHNQNEIFFRNLWIIYAKAFFTEFIKSLELNVFDLYRDRQITNKYLFDHGNIRVLRSKNITDNGRIISKEGYDKYLESLDGFVFEKYVNTRVFIVPNFTYNTRASLLPRNTACNGSICLFIPKMDIDNNALDFYSSNEFREYFRILKNRSKFTINIDRNTIYYMGIRKKE